MDWILARWRPLLVALLLPAVAVAGCGGRDSADGGDASASGRVRVVAAFYPLEEAARQIGGDRVQVTDLTPPGGEPHELDPAPAAMRALEQSRLVLYLGEGFQRRSRRR